MAQRVWRLEDQLGQAVQGTRAREYAAEEVGRRSRARQSHAAGNRHGILLGPRKTRSAVRMLRCGFYVSERRACRVLKQPRATQRQSPVERADEEPLTRRIIELAAAFGRYGYRRIAALLNREDWRVNHKRVERIRRQQGLKIPKKQPKHGRLWLNDGSCVRLRAEHKGHVWAHDFVQDRTADGRRIQMLTIVDEFTRKCLAIDVGRSLKSDDVLEQLAWLMATTARSSPRRLFESSYITSVCERCSSSREDLGRAVTSRASTASCVTSCWLASASTR